MAQLTNASGTVTKTYDYDAFGNEKSPDPADPNPFRYCGEYWDQETGTIYLRARYYDPTTGRFLSEDPIKDGLNWYTYCSNSPVMFIDPLGLKEVAVRATIEGLGGTVTWNNALQAATVLLDGSVVTVYDGDKNSSFIRGGYYIQTMNGCL